MRFQQWAATSKYKCALIPSPPSSCRIPAWPRLVLISPLKIC